MRTTVVLAALLCCAPAAQAETAESVSQFGITWTFDKAYECGRFANGDWWVVGPVRIVAVEPACTTVEAKVQGRYAEKYDPTKIGSTFEWIKNGSMINPTPLVGVKQGYDNTVGISPVFAKEMYDPALNVGTGISREKPLVLQPDSSLVSTISRPTPYNRPQPDIGAVLTVLKGPAPAGSFRPPYSGSDKTVRYNKSQLKWDLLLKLPPPASAPSIDEVTQWFEKPWLDHVPTWAGSNAHPIKNLPDYPAEMCRRVSIASLMLLLDLPKEQKEKLLIGFVQVGIDQYEIYEQTKDKPEVSWGVGAGFGSGRKWPILFAGIMLGEEKMQKLNMLKMCNEDGQTYYGDCWTGAKVCWGMQHTSDKERVKPGNEDHEEKHPSQWTCDGRGKPGDATAGNCSNARSEGYKRCCNSMQWVGEALAARLMGATKVWNHDPFFDYVDRWMTEDDTELLKVTAEHLKGDPFNRDKAQFRQGTSNSPFVDEMWKKYRPTVQPPPTGWKTGPKK